MSNDDVDEFGNLSLLELFRIEVESHAAMITDGLLELERNPSATARIESLMRSAHTLKGAARIVSRESAIRLAHAMEDCFLAAQRGSLVLKKRHINVLLRAVDLLVRSAQHEESTIGEWQRQHRSEIEDLVTMMSEPVTEDETGAANSESLSEESLPTAISRPVEPARADAQPPPPIPDRFSDLSSRVLRIAPESFNRLLGFSAETAVASHWLEAFASDLHRIRRLQKGVALSLSRLGEAMTTVGDERLRARMGEVQQNVNRTYGAFVQRLEEFENFGLRFAGLSKRLYQEVLDCRMRPFADGVRGFPRMVRDVAHSLDKRVKLEIVGETTPVDRDILERLDAPLGHLLRNAIDHGLEPPVERRLSGKSEEGTIRLEARHSSGMLLITVADDGHGLDLQRMRQILVERKFATEEVSQKLSESELVDFLFLPGFTMKESVTEISGRGVGLDVVRVMVKETGGTLRVSSSSGHGMSVEMRLPLTLSVIRALLVDIAGEPYAFPLARIAGVMKVPKDQVESVEGREHITIDGRSIGLVAGQQILGVEGVTHGSDELSIVLIGTEETRYGVVVDGLRGEQELVVRPLDSRIGAVKDISAAALLSDQWPVLIVDVDGMIRSIDSLVSADRLAQIRKEVAATASQVRKRVLVVEDSLTVRELERKLLNNHGYDVDVAVDGMEGWNAVRTGSYDLVITDVDMPRLDGIELIRLIRKDHRLRSLPVMVVSYKDREEDRRRGLEAGADYYVAKGSFHHEVLLQAVADLIGSAS